MLHRGLAIMILDAFPSAQPPEGGPGIHERRKGDAEIDLSHTLISVHGMRGLSRL